MALERKDVRAAVDDEVHKALVVFAKHDNCSVAEYVERLIQADISKRLAEVRDTYDALARAGLVRKMPEAPK